jgi:DNA-directed RNA polymerase specialized sigma24 family protein
MATAMSCIDEATLAERLRRDDQRALCDVLTLYGEEALWRMVRHGLSVTDADEALGAALYKLWKWRDRFDANRNTIEGWFLMLCEQAAVDAARRHKTNPTAQLADPDVVPSRPPADEGPVSPSEDLEDLETVLNELSDADRAIALGRAQGGDWAAPLAEGLGMTANAVRVRGWRVFATIRARMAELRAARAPQPAPGQGVAT